MTSLSLANFSSEAATVSFNFLVTSVNFLTCALTSSALVFSLSSTNLTSAKVCSTSFVILLILSLSVDLNKVSKLIDNFFSSVFSTFALTVSSTFFSTVAGLFWVNLDLSSFFSFLLISNAVAAILLPTCPSCDAGIFSAFADTPPKKIRDAIATLAAPKWYFLIEKRVSFSPSLYWNLI